MRFKFHNDCRAALAACAVLTILPVLAVSALAAGRTGPCAGAEVPQTLGGYTLQDITQTPEAAELCYAEADGGQIVVTYKQSTGEPQGVAVYYGEPLLYACYSTDSANGQVTSLTYTVDDCAVTVESRDSAGQAAPTERQALLPVIDQLQRGCVPFAAGVCTACGGAVYRQAAEAGEWAAVSHAPCGHGGRFRYNDVQHRREVCIRSVCGECGKETQEMLEQEAPYCFYGQRWYGRSLQ